jgi:hypothetical protein
MAAAEADGDALGDAAVVEVEPGVAAAVGVVLDDPVAEQAAIATASAGTRRTTTRPRGRRHRDPMVSRLVATGRRQKPDR